MQAFKKVMSKKNSGPKSKPKLTYFPINARAAPIRTAFAVGKMEYEDIHMPFPEFAEKKATLALGQLPILEVDGKQITQSMAILRWVGKQTGMYPSDDWQAAEVDECISILSDYLAIMSRSVSKKDEQEALRKEIVEKVIPQLFPYLDKKVGDNPSGFLVGSKISIADIFAFYTVKGILDGMFPPVAAPSVEPYPNLIALKEKIGAIPEVQAELARFEQKCPDGSCDWIVWACLLIAKSFDEGFNFPWLGAL